jgi:hypothetical protein
VIAAGPRKRSPRTLSGPDSTQASALKLGIISKAAAGLVRKNRAGLEDVALDGRRSMVARAFKARRGRLMNLLT